MSAGTPARLLCLPLFTVSLASCHEAQPRRIADMDPHRRPPAKSLMKEFEANLDGLKKASAKNPAGAPVHVDTRVPPAAPGAAHHDHAAGDPKGC